MMEDTVATRRIVYTYQIEISNSEDAIINELISKIVNKIRTSALKTCKYEVVVSRNLIAAYFEKIDCYEYFQKIFEMEHRTFMTQNGFVDD